MLVNFNYLRATRYLREILVANNVVAPVLLAVQLSLISKPSRFEAIQADPSLTNLLYSSEMLVFPVILDETQPFVAREIWCFPIVKISSPLAANHPDEKLLGEVTRANNHV